MIKQNKFLYYLTLIIFCLFVLFRIPELIEHPRFWAEEATVYFKDAYLNGIFSIFHAHLGYYSIIPSVSTWLATLVPLKYSPIITTITAYLIQIIPLLLIYSSNSKITILLIKRYLHR